MSKKRFTETQKWSDPWFRKLPPDQKLVWLYLLDAVDFVGVLELDAELAEFQIGITDFDWDEFVSTNSDRIMRLENGKIWIRKFVEFQFGTALGKSMPHQSARKLLEKHGLLDQVRFEPLGKPLARVGQGLDKGCSTLAEGLGKACLSPKEKEKDKEREKEKDKEKETGSSKRFEYPELFERFWAAFPRGRKDGKGKAVKVWREAIKTENAETIIAASAEYADSPRGRSEYVKSPTVWLTARDWEADRAAWGKGEPLKQQCATQDDEIIF